MILKRSIFLETHSFRAKPCRRIGPGVDLPARDAGVQAMSSLKAAIAGKSGKPRKEWESFIGPTIGLHSCQALLARRGATGVRAMIDVAPLVCEDHLATCSTCEEKVKGASSGLLPFRAGGVPSFAPQNSSLAPQELHFLSTLRGFLPDRVAAHTDTAVRFVLRYLAETGVPGARLPDLFRPVVVALHVQTLRAMVGRLARRLSATRGSVSGMACRGTSTALHPRGGHGVLRPFAFQRLARSARIFHICQGSPEFQRGIIASHIL